MHHQKTESYTRENEIVISSKELVNLFVNLEGNPPKDKKNFPSSARKTKSPSHCSDR